MALKSAKVTQMTRNALTQRSSVWLNSCCCTDVCVCCRERIRVMGSPEGPLASNCVNNKCNPVAIGGDAFSATHTSQHTTITTQPRSTAGSSRGPHQQAPDAATTTVTRTTTTSSSSAAAGGSVTAGPDDPMIVAQPGPGLRRLQCIETNLDECKARGPSQCVFPGVIERCPCMCGGLSQAGVGAGVP